MVFLLGVDQARRDLRKQILVDESRLQQRRLFDDLTGELASTDPRFRRLDPEDLKERVLKEVLPSVLNAVTLGASGG